MIWDCRPAPTPDKVGFSFLVVAWWIAVSPTTLSNLNFINSFLFFSKHPAPVKKEKKKDFKGNSIFQFSDYFVWVWTSIAKLPQITKLELADIWFAKILESRQLHLSGRVIVWKIFMNLVFWPRGQFTKYFGASTTKPFQALWMFEYFIHEDFSILPVMLNGPRILWTGQTPSSGQQVQKATFVDQVFALRRNWHW